MLTLGFALGLLGIMVWIDRGVDPAAAFAPARLSINYGFLLLESFLLGGLFARIRLPRISGYLVAGIVFGPHVLGLIGGDWVEPMRLIDDLALTFIALTAGAELHLPVLRKRSRTILWVCATGVVITAGGTALAVAAANRWVPVITGGTAAQVLVAGVVIGVVMVARSPTSAIAIINECRARGPFTDTVFGVTVAIDTLVILLFAVVVSVGETVAAGVGGMDVAFLAGVSGQLVASVGIGVVIGLALVSYIRRIDLDLAVVLVVLSFLITELARWISHSTEAWFGMTFHLEPLLMATAAGFVVQNFSDQGERLTRALHAVALPIFVVFFSMAGVALDLPALRRAWAAALGLVVLRTVLLCGSGYWGCRIAGEERQFARLCGMGFLAQAGVSLGLAQQVGRRFPGWGDEVTTLLVAVIAVNQLVGPVALKLALDRMGESGRADAVPAEVPEPGGGPAR